MHYFYTFTGILIATFYIKLFYLCQKIRTEYFTPGKGKPSGANKEEGLGLQATPPEKSEEYLEITDRYTTREDELALGVPVRHTNRNTSKGEETKTGENNNQ